MAYTNKPEKKHLLLGAAVMALAIVPLTSSFAQEAEEDDGDVITVTGIKRSIKDALEMKQQSTSIVEAVSAEDIGKLPDSSIAESIARLPGVAAQRDAGRARDISIRGLGPDFTSTLLNGREQVSAGDNRGVEFDQYPSELISSVLIYKTPEASLVGQGLAGTADLRTIRPLDYDSRVLNVNARYEWNEKGALNAGTDDSGYRLTGTWVDQNDEGNFGWVLSFATQSSPTQAERWDAWGYPTTGGGELIIGGAKPYVESRDLERDAFLGTFEFEPSDTLGMSLDVLYTDFKDTGILRGIEFPLQWSGASLQPGYTIEDGLVTSGTFNGVQGVVRNDTRFRDAEMFSIGGNIQKELNELWNVELDVSHSSIDRVDTDLELYAGTGSGFGNGASDNIGFNIGPGGGFVFTPTIDYADANLMLLTDPQGWGQVGFIKAPSTKDDLNAIHLTANRKVDNSFITDIDFGVNYTSREKSKRSDESFIDLANPGPNNAVPIPADLLIGSTALDFIGIPGMVSFDPMTALNSGIYSLRSNTNPDVLTKSWDVDEDVTTLFAQFNVDSEFNGVPMRGNFGLQHVMTDQSSTGASASSSGVGVYTDGADYTHTLPSANFSFEVMPDTYLRLGAAKTLARARMDAMSASQQVGINNTICTVTPPTYNAGLVDIANLQTCLSAGGGNPQLKPYTANAFDISFEKYFADGLGNFVLAGFHKDLDDFVFGNETTVIDMTGVANAIWGDAFVTANPGIETGTLSRPVNLSGGTVKGIEVSTNIPGEAFLPAPLDGLGFYASYSYTETEIQPDPNQPPIAIPGFSEDVLNTAIWYEKDGFQARLSQRYRSDFLAEVTGFGANREFRNASSETVVDAQIGYSFDSGPLDGASVVLQAYNLTDEEFSTFLNNDPRQVKDFQSYGTTYLLGFGYKY